MQACSIIRVTDPDIRKEIAREKKVTLDNVGDMDRFFSAFTDACIMAQNVVNAAESMELGTVYLGSILNDSEKICELLNLPELTFPVVGLGIGYPDQKPQIKPRMEMETYYDLRDANRRVDCFSDQIVSRLKHLIPKRQKIVASIIKQGFDLKLSDE